MTTCPCGRSYTLAEYRKLQMLESDATSHTKACSTCGRSLVRILPRYEGELFNADANCEHEVEDAPGGGVKCKKCPGWFCY